MRRARYVWLLTALLLVLAACGSSDTSGEATANTASVSETPADLGFDSGGAGDDGMARDADSPLPGAAPVAQVTPPPGRDIIFTAQMTVAVNDVARATDEATRIIDDLGGFVFGQDTTGLPEPRSVLVFKVHPRDFQRALDALGAVGELRDQQISADDVTERVVDLESRITTAEASVTRLRELIAEASDVEILATLESQLLERETQLELLRGQLRTLEGAVSLATITMVIVENLSRPSLQVTATSYFGHEDQGQSCPGDLGITVDEGEPVTVCVEIVNTGDTPLTDFSVTDTVLELQTSDWKVVFGDVEGTLERGQSLILASEITPERRFRTQTRVAASPVNEEGTVLEARAVSQVASLQIVAVDPGGLPGFDDGLSSGTELVQIIWGTIVLSAGFLVGLAPLLLVMGAVIWWLRRRRIQQQLAAETAVPPLPQTDAGDDDPTDA